MSLQKTQWANEVDWHFILGLVGIDYDKPSWEGTVLCPLCKHAAVTIYRDCALHSPWVHCRQCGFTGNPIELYARLHELDPIKAVPCIGSASGTPTHIDMAAFSQQIHYRERVDRFMEIARQLGGSSSPAQYDLLFDLRIAVYAKSFRYKDSQFRPIGKATRHEIDELFFPGSYRWRDRANRNDSQSFRRGSGPGRRAFLRGSGWWNVIVMPFYDLPGRICGFLFIGRDANAAAGDVVFRRLNFGARGRIQEAGIAMGSMLSGKISPHFQDVVFIFADPLVALRLHTGWCESNPFFLPVVAGFYDGRHATRFGFEQLGPHRQRIAYAPSPTDNVFLAGRYANASIAIMPEEDPVYPFIPHPVAWLRRIQQCAVPWRVALQDELRRREPADAVKLLAKLDLPPAELWTFVSSCNANLQGKLAVAGGESLVTPRANARGQVIVETSSGWSIERTGKQICNGRIRIQDVLIDREKDLHLSGVVGFQQSEAPFLVTNDAVNKFGLLRCIRDCLAAAGTGELIFERSWNRHGKQIAYQMYPGNTVREADKIGWRRGWLVLPRFTITMGGHIRVGQDGVLVGAETPATSMEPPTTLSRAVLRPVTLITPTTARFWAIVTHFAHNVLASALRPSSVGLVVTGAGSTEVVAAIASTFDCFNYHLKRFLKADRANLELKRVCGLHDWPVVVTPLPGRATHGLSEWLAKPEFRNFVIGLNWYAAQVAASNGWRVIEIDDPTELVKLLGEFGRNVLLGYLQDLCRRHMDYELHPSGQYSRIHRDLANWCGLIGRGKQAVMEARAVTDIDEIRPAWQPIMALIRRFLADGELRAVNRQGDRLPRVANAVVYMGAGQAMPATVWIPVSRINRLLAKHNAPFLSECGPYWSFVEAGATAPLSRFDPASFMVLKRSWWNQHLLRAVGMRLPAEFSEAS